MVGSAFMKLLQTTRPETMRPEVVTSTPCDGSQEILRSTEGGTAMKIYPREKNVCSDFIYIISPFFSDKTHIFLALFRSQFESKQYFHTIFYPPNTFIMFILLRTGEFICMYVMYSKYFIFRGDILMLCRFIHPVLIRIFFVQAVLVMFSASISDTIPVFSYAHLNLRTSPAPPLGFLLARLDLYQGGRHPNPRGGGVANVVTFIFRITRNISNPGGERKKGNLANARTERNAFSKPAIRCVEGVPPFLRGLFGDE